MSKRTSTVTFTDDTGITYMVRLPNLKQQQEGQKVYNKAFSSAVQSGALLRVKLEDFMREQGIWDEKKQAKMTELSKAVLAKEKQLVEGGIKLSEGKEVALELKQLRVEIKNLIAERMEQDVNTAEGQADNARFNYWVSACMVYNDSQKPVFSSVDDYIARSTEDLASTGASKLAELMYNLNSEFEDSLEENAFLQAYGFADSENRLINDDGHLVDDEGRLIDEDGYFVNEDGERVDIEGNLLDENGRLKLERKPFLDDDGQPVAPKQTEEPAETVEEVQA